MPKQRVYELAKELGFNKQELVSKINDLDIDISVGNYMSVLSPSEVSAVIEAMDGAAEAKKAKPKQPVDSGDDGIGPTKLRRRKKSEPEEEEDGADADTNSVGPVMRRRKVGAPEPEADDTAGETPETEEEEVAPQEEAEAPESAGEEKEEEPQEQGDEQDGASEDKEEETQDDTGKDVEEEEEDTDADADDTEEDDEASTEESADAESEDQEDEEAKDTAEDETEAETDEDAKTPAKPVRPPQPPAKKKKGEKKSKKEREDDATVVGRINENILKERLAAEDKDFSPGPSRKNKKKKGKGSSHRRGGGRRKRVVEGSDLYDGKSRRSRRRSSRKKKKRKRPQKTEITEAAEHKKVIRIEDVISVGDLAHEMGVKAGKVAMELVELGMMATVNTTLDYETAELIADEFGYTVENVAFDISNFYDTEPDPEETLEPRPPVVTVMGHVDHGKTSLLDAIRRSTVLDAEAGGITQHIGAYTVSMEDDKDVTFLDTPGHEAFTALRMRGARATDIVVLVVAADDGVMPQTVEAINHARDAEVPIVVAINKIDKPTANPDRVKTALAEYELIPEEWGGTTLFVEVSALKEENIDGLLEALALQAELEQLQANPDRRAQGLVIEAELDIGRGPVTTVLVERGTLNQSDIIVSGQYYGRVRTMHNDRAEEIEAAGPSEPVEITGLSGIPEAGEPFFVVNEENDAKRITEFVTEQRRKETMASRAKEAAGSLEELSEMIREGEMKELKIIIKGDVQGSVEALKQAFNKLGNEEVRPNIIHTGVGGITENDVNLAASSETAAVVIGFNVRPDLRAAEVADEYGVKILTYNIIYDAIEQVHQILEGLLDPIVEEEVLGHAEVRETFNAPKVGTVAGCYVTDGEIQRNAKARLLRQGRVIYDTTIGSLRRFKDDVREVKSGFECGLSLENYNDIKIGDVIEVYEHKKVAATLE